jgi:hypothetical protein
MFYPSKIQLTFFCEKWLNHRLRWILEIRYIGYLDVLSRAPTGSTLEFGISLEYGQSRVTYVSQIGNFGWKTRSFVGAKSVSSPVFNLNINTYVVLKTKKKLVKSYVDPKNRDVRFKKNR